MRTHVPVGGNSMLILNRRVNEAIVLNGVIRIVILSTEPNKVKIGIDAPPDVIILREELIQRDDQTTARLYDPLPRACFRA